MSENEAQNIDPALEKEQQREQQRKEEKALLAQKYKSRGVQQLSLSQYEALRAARKKKTGIKIPVPVKFIFATPVLFIFCYGLFFIPFTLFQIATAKSAEEKKASGASFTKQLNDKVDKYQTEP